MLGLLMQAVHCSSDSLRVSCVGSREPYPGHFCLLSRRGRRCDRPVGAASAPPRPPPARQVPHHLATTPGQWAPLSLPLPHHVTCVISPFISTAFTLRSACAPIHREHAPLIQIQQKKNPPARHSNQSINQSLTPSHDPVLPFGALQRCQHRRPICTRAVSSWDHGQAGVHAVCRPPGKLLKV